MKPASDAAGSRLCWFAGCEAGPDLEVTTEKDGKLRRTCRPHLSPLMILTRSEGMRFVRSAKAIAIRPGAKK